MIKGAIFDVDGTVLDSMTIWEHAGEVYLKNLGIEPEAELGQRTFAMSMEEGAQYLKDTYGLSKSIAGILDDINGVIREFYCYRAPLKPGIRDYLDGLWEKGIRITVATSTDRPLIEAAFARLGIADYFEQIFTCSEVGIGKQQPEIYHRAAAVMGTVPGETLVFEDALHAIETADKAGYQTVGVYDAFSLAKQEKIKELVKLYLMNFENFNGFWKTASAL